MTRRKYAVKANDVMFASKSAYNSSLRAIEDHIRQVSKEGGEAWELIWSAGVKDARGEHTQGARTWRSTSGREIAYSILRLV